MTEAGQEQQNGNLVWVDMEMSGLDPETDVILEIATIVTNQKLEIIEQGPSLILHHEQTLFAKMDQWNQEHHTKSGLWDAVLKSDITVPQAEAATLQFIKKHVNPKESPLCGSSVWQDRRFIRRYMKSFNDHLHYRLIDVTSIKELVNRWYPEGERFRAKKNNHRAMDDILESLAELKYYREKFFRKIEPV